MIFHHIIAKTQTGENARPPLFHSILAVTADRYGFLIFKGADGHFHKELTSHERFANILSNTLSGDSDFVFSANFNVPIIEYPAMHHSNTCTSGILRGSAPHRIVSELNRLLRAPIYKILIRRIRRLRTPYLRNLL